MLFIKQKFQKARSVLHKLTRPAAIRPEERTFRDEFILFIAPEAGLTPFYMTHAVLAKLIDDSKVRKSIILSCDGFQRTCNFKMASGLRVTQSCDERDHNCQICKEEALRVKDAYQLQQQSIEHLLSSSERTKIQDLLAEFSGRTEAASFDGIDFGIACLGEVMRAKGKSRLKDFADEDYLLMEGLLQASFSIYFAVKKFCSSNSVNRIVYFGDYAYYLGPQILAQKFSIPITHISHAYNRDIDRRKVVFMPGFAFLEGRKQVDNWHRYDKILNDEETIDGIVDSSLFRLSGHGGVSTFSPNLNTNIPNIKTELGLDNNRKTIAAFASSFDELACIEKFLTVFNRNIREDRNPFKSQIEWLQETAKWVGENPDTQLVIRLHPRMAVNARTPGAAAEYGRMMEALSDLPSNVVLIGAESRYSSYNIAEITDVAAVGWSSMGLELSRFGVPVICAFPDAAMFPTDGFIETAASDGDYFVKMRALLDVNLKIDRIKEAFRWTSLLYGSHCIDMSDIFPAPDFEGIPIYVKPSSSYDIERILIKGEDVVDINLKKRPSGPAAEHAELQGIRRAIMCYIYYFVSGERPPNISTFHLSIGNETKDHNRDALDCVVDIDQENTLVLRSVSKVWKRSSPLAARLVRLLQTDLPVPRSPASLANWVGNATALS